MILPKTSTQQVLVGISEQTLTPFLLILLHREQVVYSNMELKLPGL
jgi:hypothetical protein